MQICFVILFSMMSKKNSFEAEKFFLALADRTRLRLLNLMRQGEVCVCYFVEILQSPQSSISRHLAYLRKAGVVAARREGKWMHYRITAPADPEAAQLFSAVQSWLQQQPEFQRDLERLVKICCASRKPFKLQRAPRPVNLPVGGK